jgi:UDP-3-O-[3-hydroxymyristoyl] N-acetylglucosamine deacetylase
MHFSIDPFQHTVKKPISCRGIGLHSGRPVNLNIKPAPVNSGIQFSRTDLPHHRPVKAHMNKVVDTRLATTIGEGGTTISTTEHLLAAMSSFGIDNAEIELDSAEVPIMDGSAAPFISLLKNAGKKRQAEYRRILKITQEICYTDGDKTLKISPYNGFKVSGRITFDDTLIKSQSYCIEVNTERFIQEISSARTFGYVEQVEELWANGLALGGNLDNVIAIHWNRNSVLNEDGLRFEDEFIRHKVLDIIGDMTLLGCPLLGHIQAYKSGHTQHLAFMQAIANAPECWELIELKKNGSHSVLDQVFSSTKAAGKLIMPFLKHRPIAVPQS